MRRRSAKWQSPERWFLELSRLFGYGSRIGRPLLLWLLVGLATTGVFVGLSMNSLPFLPLLLDVLFSPLTFLRGIEDSVLQTAISDSGNFGTNLFRVTRLIGAAAITYFVIAVRAYTRLT